MMLDKTPERKETISEALTPQNETKDMQDKELILQFFSYDHLPVHLQLVSGPFGQLANQIVELLPRNPERTVALRKLLEAKDAAVRARLFSYK